MNDLVQRLAQGTHPLTSARADTASNLKAAIDRGYVLLEFSETRGGTELGVPLDAPACSWRGADFAAAQGSVHLEGDLQLDYVHVRLIAHLDLATLRGQGHLVVRK